MFFSSEMKPSNFVDYLHKYFDADKAEASKKGKLALVTWLGNVVEAAEQHKEWYLSQPNNTSEKYAKLQFRDDKTPLDWLRNEYDFQQDQPCHLFLTSPTQRKSFKRKQSYGRLFKELLRTIAAKESGLKPLTDEAVSLPHEACPAFEAVLQKPAYEQFLTLAGAPADKDVITGSPSLFRSR